jgi:hypothetical protein
MNLFYIVYQVVPRDPPSGWADLEQQLVFISRTKAERYVQNHQGIFLIQEMWAQRWIEGKPSPVKFREAKNWKGRKKMALPLSLQARIIRTITEFAAEHKMKKEVVVKILKDINEDQILSELKLSTSATVRILIDHHSENGDSKYADLLLYVGPRDFQWRMRDGELVGAGTRVEGGIIDEDCSRRS